MVGRAILLLTYNCPSPNTMSSRHWCATEEYRIVVKTIAGKSWYAKEGESREFRIVVKTIAGKSYEITKLEGFYQVGYLKDILRNRIIPTPSTRRMSMIFENNMLDDNKMLSEYNICEGSELDLVMLSPPRIGLRLDRSRSRSPFCRPSRGRSPSLREGSPTRVHMLEVCREV